MKGLFLLFAIACGCSSRGDAQPAAPPPPPAPPRAPALPDAAPPPPPAPAAETSHTIVSGDKLDPIAQARYGSRHYSRLIELVDHVSSNKLRVGMKLALPSIEDMARPLAQKVPDGTAALLRARATWAALVPTLWDEHRQTHHLAQHPEMAHIVSDVQSAREAFAKAHAPTKQLDTLANALAGVAEGHLDPNAYGLDEVDRRFAYAIGDLLTWSAKR